MVLLKNKTKILIRKMIFCLQCILYQTISCNFGTAKTAFPPTQMQELTFRYIIQAKSLIINGPEHFVTESRPNDHTFPLAEYAYLTECQTYHLRNHSGPHTGIWESKSLSAQAIPPLVLPPFS